MSQPFITQGTVLVLPPLTTTHHTIPVNLRYFWMSKGQNMCGVSDCASYPLVA
jgi:hypothetical protein